LTILRKADAQGKALRKIVTVSPKPEEIIEASRSVEAKLVLEKDADLKLAAETLVKKNELLTKIRTQLISDNSDINEVNQMMAHINTYAYEELLEAEAQMNESLSEESQEFLSEESRESLSEESRESLLEESVVIKFKEKKDDEPLMSFLECDSYYFLIFLDIFK
jgi:hypothetical protein